MKTRLLIIITSIGLLVSIPYSFASESFYGTSSFEKLPSSIVPNDSQIIEIKFQYQDGPYSLNDLKPIIDVSPKGAVPFVHIEFESIEGIYRNSIARIHGTINVDPNIESEKIFLNISYVGTDLNDVLFKSGWNDSAIINIAQSVIIPDELVPEPGPLCPAGTMVKNDVCVVANTDCGEGTIYQDGICVVDETEKQSVDPSNCWGGSACNYDVESPLKQFKSGLTIDEIHCRNSLILVVKYDDSPACVTYETGSKMVERGWGICSDLVSYGRENPCGPHSSDVVSFDSYNEVESELSPITKSIITVQDRPVNRTIVPITITEKTTNAESLDTITQWNFSILGIEMSTLNDYWGNLADQYITTEFVDQNGNDVLDYTRIPDGMIFYKLSLWYYPATCEDGQKIIGEGGYPEPIPIKKGASDIFFKSGSIGLYPDDDGKYFFDFVSGFETEIEFHPNVKVISQETKKCDLEIERGNFTDVYYTNAVFSFED